MYLFNLPRFVDKLATAAEEKNDVNSSFFSRMRNHAGNEEYLSTKV